MALGMTMRKAITVKKPITSQLQVNITSNALAQRRAWIDPAPSQIKASASKPYIKSVCARTW